jgi:hypothetical protein
MPQVLDPTAFYKLLFKWTVGGHDALSRFFFGRSGDPDLLDALDLAQSVLGWLVPALTPILSQESILRSVYAENLADLTDYAEVTTVPLPQGARPGNHVGPWAAWGYKLSSDDRAIRSGGKRFPGVSEDDVDQGLLDGNSPISQDVLDFADFLKTPIPSLASVNDEWLPVLYTPGNTATGGIPWWAYIADASYERFTTQNTRKPWL